LKDVISIKVGTYYDNYRDAEIKSIRDLGYLPHSGSNGNTYDIHFICPPALKNGPGPEDYNLGSARYPYYVIVYTKDGGVSGINQTYGSFQYFLPPVIETMSVNVGSTKGGTVIGITGKRLQTNLQVFFNGAFHNRFNICNQHNDYNSGLLRKCLGFKKYCPIKTCTDRIGPAL
jgi:hypothetical protein